VRRYFIRTAKISRWQQCNNEELGNIRQEQRETNNQTPDLDVAEITLSTLDENSGTSTAIHRGSENRHNDKHISPIQEVLQWPTPPKR